MGDVDPKAVDAAIGPKPYGAPEILTDFLVLPVEIGLLRSETVEIPLAVTGWGPRPSAEDRFPVIGWLLTSSATTATKQVTITLGSARAGSQRLHKPGMSIGGVIGHDVDDHPDPGAVQGRHHRVAVG